MIDNLLVTTLLSPVLIPQGLYVRLVTPKLPEAKGGRKGEDGSGQSLKILVLGDSAAAGVGVEQQKYALTGQLVSKLSPHYKLSWRIEAEGGFKTADTIHHLKRLNPFTTDLVIVSLGVNDVTGGTSLDSWLALQKELRSILIKKFNAKHILLSRVPPMGEFTSLPQPLRWCLGRRSKAFNEVLKQCTRELAGLTLIEPDFPMTEDFIAVDGFHPSALAYDFWANIIVNEINKLQRSERKIKS